MGEGEREGRREEERAVKDKREKGIERGLSIYRFWRVNLERKRFDLSNEVLLCVYGLAMMGRVLILRKENRSGG